MKPSNKMVAVGLSGAVTTIVVWAWNSFQPTHILPAEIVAAVQTVVVFLSGYFMPNADA